MTGTIPDAADRSRPKFKRYLIGQLSHREIHRISMVFMDRGYKVYLDSHRAVIDGVNSQLDVRHTNNWVMTGDNTELDQAIDQMFKQLVEERDDLRARCSDCFAHFVNEQSLIEIPRPSGACEASQAKHPVKLHQRRVATPLDELLPEDPLEGAQLVTAPPDLELEAEDYGDYEIPELDLDLEYPDASGLPYSYIEGALHA